MGIGINLFVIPLFVIEGWTARLFVRGSGRVSIGFVVAKLRCFVGIILGHCGGLCLGTHLLEYIVDYFSDPRTL
jgi:hypothetical protein